MRWRHTAEPMKPAPPVTSTRMCSLAPTPCILDDETAPQIRQWRMLRILWRQDRLMRCNRPGDGESRIIPFEASVALGCIVVRDLVEHLGIGLERAETVGEA